jgi:hypothetical protein
MKMKYSPPTIKRKLFPGRVILSLRKKNGFIEVFWAEFKERCKTCSDTRKEDVFNDLNDEYFKYVGIYRYENYESFRRRINK